MKLIAMVKMMMLMKILGVLRSVLKVYVDAVEIPHTAAVVVYITEDNANEDDDNDGYDDDNNDNNLNYEQLSSYV